MKINETVTAEDGQLRVVQTHDVSASLRRSEIMRANGLGRFGEMEAIGSIPMVLANEWLREAGLTWDSPREDLRRLFVRKLVDGDFAKLRTTDRRL